MDLYIETNTELINGEIIKESGALEYADSFVEELLKITKDEVVKYKNKHIKDILIGLMVYIKLREK